MEEVRSTAHLESALWEGRETGLSCHTRVGPAGERSEDKVGGVTEDYRETRAGQQGLLAQESKSVGDQIWGKGVR